MRRLMIALVLAILVAPVTGLAIGSADLYAAYEQMQQIPAQPAEVIELSDYTLERHDFAFRIESGRFFFFEPLDINGARHDWGGLFVGKGLFQFEPQLPMERNQMQLFFESDSLNRECEYAVMLFNDTVAAWLREAGTPVEDAPPVLDEDARDELETLHAHLTRNENKAYLFEALRNVTFPLRRPFLLVDADLDDATEVFYIFNPAQREEVSLLKDYKEFFVSFFMETVCNYSVYADRTYRKINGINRERIKTSHYTINSTIDRGGNMTCRAEMKYETLLSPTQMLVLHLNAEAIVDSIIDSDGATLSYLRYNDWGNKTDSLYLFLDKPMAQGEDGKLTFYYHGDMCERREGIMTVEAGDNWYPRHGTLQRSTYSLEFVTPEEFTFAASGEKLEERVSNKMRHTRWVVRDKLPAASFTIGEFDKFDYATDVAPIELYISETVKRDYSRNLPDSKKLGGRQMRQRVADDVSGALKLFTHYFGNYRLPKLLVTETLVPRGESFPGIVHLNWEAVHLADMWGEQRLRRANMVARQWWGNGVLYDDYRDEWLTESFASYSALLYLQAAEGNDRFFWWLREYRKQIRSMHKFVGSGSNRAVPIALGYRTLSTETEFTMKPPEEMTEAGYASISNLQDHRSSVEVEEFSSTLFGEDDDPKNDQSGVVRFRKPRAEILGAPDLSETGGLENPVDTAMSDQEVTIYRKGAYVLHMLRNMLMDLETLDDSRFFQMMTEWHDLFYGRRATTEQFKLLTEKYCGMPMDWFFDQWVYGYYIPEYTFSYEITPGEDGNYQAVCTVTQSGVPDDFRMFVPIEIEFKGGGVARLRLLIDRPEQQITLPPLESEPNRITFNPFESVLARVNQ